MDATTAGICVQFLRRVQITGAEAPPFMAVLAAIEAIARGDVVMRAPAKSLADAINEARPPMRIEGDI